MILDLHKCNPVSAEFCALLEFLLEELNTSRLSTLDTVHDWFLIGRGQREMPAGGKGGGVDDILYEDSLE